MPKKEFRRTSLLSDIGSMDLAQKSYEFLMHEDIPKGLHVFDEVALYVNRFACGEIDIDIRRNTRGTNVLLFKSPIVFPSEVNEETDYRIAQERLIYDANASQMELCFMNDALMRGSAKSITDVCLHQPYQRQDRRAIRIYEQPDGSKKRKRTRSAISARVVADQIESSGASGLITLDPHFKQLEALYKIPVDILFGNLLFAYDIEKKFGYGNKDLVILGTDASAFYDAEELAYLLDCIPGVIFKRRLNPGEKAESLGIMLPPGISPKGKMFVARDDLADTLSSLVSAQEHVMGLGASYFMAAITHAVLSDPAVERANEAKMPLWVTNSNDNPKIDELNDVKKIDASFLISLALLANISGETLGEHILDYKGYKRKLDIYREMNGIENRLGYEPLKRLYKFWRREVRPMLRF